LIGPVAADHQQVKGGLGRLFPQHVPGLQKIGEMVGLVAPLGEFQLDYIAGGQGAGQSDCGQFAHGDLPSLVYPTIMSLP
jgi:hypothetical protein